MLKVTQKEIKSYYNGKNNLNEFTREELDTIKHDLKQLAISFGVYGMNGGLFIDSKGNYYIIPNRSTRLFELC